MTFNEITGISVGADLSCTSPMYRPYFHDIPLVLFNSIIAPKLVTLLS